MSLISMRTFVARTGASVNCTSLPWNHFQRWFATKQKKVSDIIRWNLENKMLYGSKQTVTKKKTPEMDSIKGTRNLSQTDREISPKTRTAKARTSPKTGKKEEAKMTSASEAAGSANFSQTENLTEWWDEEKTATDRNKSDMFHIENAYYNQLVDSGKCFEGSEDTSASWDSDSRNGVDIPQLLPIPQGKNAPHKTGTASGLKSSSSQKSPKVSGATSLSNFKAVDFIQQFPLLSAQSAEMQASVQEFRSFVESLNLRVLPTVNTVLNKTRTDLSSFFLQRWREKMISELGEAGFKKHQEATIWQGVNLHACVQQYLSGVPLADIQVQESSRGHWDSLSSVLPDVTEVQALETSVSHPWLCYKGTFDCIAKYQNTLYVIDWKTSSKPKPLLSNLYDNPLQVVAYMGAINLTSDLTDKCGVINQAAIVVAYTNGEAAHVHRLQPALCQHYWGEWCQRLHQYWSGVAAQKGV
ncbi:uncharacterized protein LOC143281692 [Babylonia areolata]|uniref:uncharacterized protein LOC143281692 n=1 Tax=Babylonia areolata TaxID=304850 RepID=UPI003FD02324